MNGTLDSTEALYEGQRIAQDMWETGKFFDELNDLRATLAGEEIVESNLDRIERAARMPSFETLTMKILGFLGFDVTENAPEGVTPLYPGKPAENTLYRRVGEEVQRIVINYDNRSVTGIAPNYKVNLELPELIQAALDKPISYQDF